MTHRHAAEKKQPFSQERKWTASLLSLMMVFQTPVEEFSASGTEWFAPWTGRIKRCTGRPCAAVTIGRRDGVTMYSFCFEIKVVRCISSDFDMSSVCSDFLHRWAAMTLLLALYIIVYYGVYMLKAEPSVHRPVSKCNFICDLTRAGIMWNQATGMWTVAIQNRSIVQYFFSIFSASKSIACDPDNRVQIRC